MRWCLLLLALSPIFICCYTKPLGIPFEIQVNAVENLLGQHLSHDEFDVKSHPFKTSTFFHRILSPPSPCQTNGTSKKHYRELTPTHLGCIDVLDGQTLKPTSLIKEKETSFDTENNKKYKVQHRGGVRVSSMGSIEPMDFETLY